MSLFTNLNIINGLILFLILNLHQVYLQETVSNIEYYAHIGIDYRLSLPFHFELVYEEKKIGRK